MSKIRFSTIISVLRARCRRVEGQTMSEYAVVLLVIAAGTILAFTALSGGISEAIDAAAGMFG